METIDVYVERVIYRNESNGYGVLMTQYEDEELVVVGYFQTDVTGQMLRITGMFGYHQSHGEQFKAENYEVIEPTDVDSIRRYLSSRSVPYTSI